MPAPVVAVRPSAPNPRPGRFPPVSRFKPCFGPVLRVFRFCPSRRPQCQLLGIGFFRIARGSAFFSQSVWMPSGFSFRQMGLFGFSFPFRFPGLKTCSGAQPFETKLLFLRNFATWPLRQGSTCKARTTALILTAFGSREMPFSKTAWPWEDLQQRARPAAQNHTSVANSYHFPQKQKSGPFGPDFQYFVPVFTGFFG